MAEAFEAVLFYVIRILTSVFEIFLAFTLMDGFFKEKYTHRHPRRIAFIGSVLILLLLQEAGRGELVRTAVKIILIFAISLLLYDGKFKFKLIYNVVFSILLSISGMLASFSFSQVIDKIDFIDKESFFYRILNIEMGNVFLMVFVILIGLFVRTKKQNISFRYWILLLTVPVTTLITLTVYQFYMDRLPPGDQINAYIVISSVGLVFINILVFTLFAKLQNQLEIQSSNELFKNQMMLEAQSYKRLEESYNRTRELRHDLKNHLFILRGIAENGTRDELLSYMNTMVDTVEESTYISVSKNSAVDAILNEKLILAQKHGIATQYEVCDLQDTHVQPMDLCAILSNALDNAVEANEKLPEQQARYIRLKIDSDEKSLVISVENPVLEPPKKRAGKYVTTKDDGENHGIGLKSIKKTVEKYNGDMMLRCENLVFYLIVKLNIT